MASCKWFTNNKQSATEVTEFHRVRKKANKSHALGTGFQEKIVILRCLTLRSLCSPWRGVAVFVSDNISWLRVSGSPTTNNLPLRSQSFTEFGRKQTRVML